jgi:hypothetical protein
MPKHTSILLRGTNLLGGITCLYPHISVTHLAPKVREQWVIEICGPLRGHPINSDSDKNEVSWVMI